MTRKWTPFLADDAVEAPSNKNNKVKVTIKPLKLDGLTQQLELLQAAKNDVVAIEATLDSAPTTNPTGRRTILPLVIWRKRRVVRNLTTEKPLRNGCKPVEWTEDEFRFSFNSRNDWSVTFSVLHGQSGKKLNKMVNLGGVRLKFAKLEAANFVEELPVTLQFDTFALDVSLTVSVTILDNSNDLSNSGKLSNEEEAGFFSKSFWRKKRTKIAQGVGVTSSESDESAAFDSGRLVDRRSSSMPRLDSGFSKFGYLKRKLSSFRKIQPLTNSKQNSGLLSEEVNVDRSSSHFPIDSAATSVPRQSTDSTEPPKSTYEESFDRRDIKWESKVLESRDGKAKLAAEVSFASFDQRGEEAAGASACTAIVANIAHWLHTNQGIVPTTSEFEGIIKEGSLEWQKLCEDPQHLNCFPNRHFDLETVFRAHDKPVTLLHERLFVGFISPGKFKALEGLMSCDSIWDEIHKEMEEHETRIYIVGWNDHFFVLMMQEDAYYIIDSLGERLSEGCHQAYILKFDESTKMFNTRTKEEVGDDERVKNEEIVCSGKDCCKEYIQRFLAAITLEELEEEEKKSSVSSSSLHQRLQIEFHYTSHSTDVSSNSSVF